MLTVVVVVITFVVALWVAAAKTFAAGSAKDATNADAERLKRDENSDDVANFF